MLACKDRELSHKVWHLVLRMRGDVNPSTIYDESERCDRLLPVVLDFKLAGLVSSERSLALVPIVGGANFAFSIKRTSPNRRIFLTTESD